MVAYQPSLAGKPAAVSKSGPIIAIAAALDHLRHDVIGLLGELDAGLTDAAVIDRIGIQRLDLGQDGRVVGGLRIEPVAAEDLDAFLLGLPLERVRDPTP